MTTPTRYRTTRRNGYQPAGMRVDVITLTATTHGGEDGQWLRVTYPSGVLAAAPRQSTSAPATQAAVPAAATPAPSPSDTLTGPVGAAFTVTGTFGATTRPGPTRSPWTR